MITLKEWATKTTNPEQTFDGVISKLRTWTSINDLSLSEVWDYTIFLYGGLLIPDYPALTLKAMTTAWAAVNNYKFNTLSDSTKQVYNPIENYDRYEDLSTDTTTTDEVSTTRTPNLTTETERTPSLTTTDTDTRTITTDSEGSAGSEGSVAAYDSANYSPDAKTTSESEGTTTETHSGALTRVETGTDTTTTTDTGTDTTATDRTQTTGTTSENHIHGNIGVTSAQDMLRQEREIANFVFLDTFLSEWAGRFTIGIYAPGCADATNT